MKIITVFAVAGSLALAGCGESKETALAQCRMDALRNHISEWDSGYVNDC